MTYCTATPAYEPVKPTRKLMFSVTTLTVQGNRRTNITSSIRCFRPTFIHDLRTVSRLFLNVIPIIGKLELNVKTGNKDMKYASTTGTSTAG